MLLTASVSSRDGNSIAHMLPRRASPSHSPTTEVQAAMLRAMAAPKSEEPNWLSMVNIVQQYGTVAACTHIFDTHVGLRLSPLHLAARHARPEYVSFFLARGCPVSPLRSDRYTQSALLCCVARPAGTALVEQRSVEVIHVLARHGADIDARCGGESCSWNALGHAVASGSVARVQALLKCGANPNARYRDGSTPLHCAAAIGNLEMARLLVEAGGSTDMLNFAPNAPPRTPADVAYWGSYNELGDWLRSQHLRQEYRFVRE